jgi:hypothetical protein
MSGDEFELLVVSSYAKDIQFIFACNTKTIEDDQELEPRG